MAKLIILLIDSNVIRANVSNQYIPVISWKLKILLIDQNFIETFPIDSSFTRIMLLYKVNSNNISQEYSIWMLHRSIITGSWDSITIIHCNGCSSNRLQRGKIYTAQFISTAQNLSGYFISAFRFCNCISPIFLPLHYNTVRSCLPALVVSVSKWTGLLQIIHYVISLCIQAQSDREKNRRKICV